jgi:thiol-disulfide isomerase/thioredoxin
MNKIRLIVCVCLITIFITPSFAQTGIQFSNASWQEMLAEARQTGKLIFMDAYAVWCGPCKWMNKNVFPVPAVANLYNRNFVNAYIDMEKGEGITLRQQYNVRAYPTYLFINGNGDVVHRIVGSCDTSVFIQAALDALSPFRSLQYFNDNYTANQHDFTFTRDYARALSRAGEADKANEVTLAYLQALQPDSWLQPLHWELIREYVTDATSPVFRHIVQFQQSFNKAFGEKVVDDKIYQTYLAWPRRYITYPKEGPPILDEAGYQAFINQVKNSGYHRMQEVLAQSELTIRMGMRQWSAYAAVVAGMLKDGLIDTTARGAATLYAYADNINRFAANDQAAVTAALQWAKMIARDVPGINAGNKALYLELYANLLEKNGRRREAKKVRKEVDQQKLLQAKQGIPFQQMRIIPKQQ